MKVTAWLVASGIVTASIAIVLVTAFAASALAFQDGTSLSIHNMVARSMHGSTGVVPTQPGNPPGVGTVNPQAKRVRPNPTKCYNSCMKGGGGTWSDVQFCAYSCL
ncbi:MAG: hypothetical protein ACLP5H_33225 [Desulfomonilaceae bacterium]